MISLNTSSDFIIFTYFYLIMYNLSLFAFFSMFFYFAFDSHTTLNLFEKINQFQFPLLVISLTLISLAGVPPSIGFVSKLLIFIALLETPLSLFLWLFFPLLMMSLYFYVQNISFLFTQTSSSFSIVNNFKNINLQTLVTSQLILITIVFGFLLFEDIWLLISWLFI